MNLKFVKLNGLGNSFVFFDARTQNLDLYKTPEIIAKICSVQNGVGADGVVFVEPSEKLSEVCKMIIYNSDGSRAQMCGNALRCLAHLLFKTLPRNRSLAVGTDAGERLVTYISSDELLYKTSMGIPSFDLLKTGEILADGFSFKTCGKKYEVTYVNVGNPHGVVVVDEIFPNNLIERDCSAFEKDSNHPQKMNLELVLPKGRDRIQVTVYERGCGFTAACGTGAVASAAACRRKGICGDEVIVDMPGGSLNVSFDEEGTAYLTASVAEVCSGIFSESFF